MLRIKSESLYLKYFNTENNFFLLIYMFINYMALLCIYDFIIHSNTCVFNRICIYIYRMTEDEMAGWHHRLDGHEFE